MSKTNFEASCETLEFHTKYWWHETDGEILPVFAIFLWGLKFIFSSFHGNYFFLELWKKSKKDFGIIKIILVQGFCTLKTEIAPFPIGFRLKI